jgi:3-oxoacyl-[acyl-carrier-protein] synthase-3
MYDERSRPPRPRCRSLLGLQVLGTGSYVPDAVITNDHLHNRFNCDADWIVKQTGIHERRHALDNQATSDLCVEAGRRCLENAKTPGSNVDLLLVATVTPDMSFPSVACLVQDKLRLTCASVDVQAACAGFVYALVTAGAYVISGASDCCLVIGGDCMSRVINPGDVKTYPLLGDGAGAVLVTHGRPDQGIMQYSLGAEGSGGDLLTRPACGSRLPPTPALLADGMHYLHMNGRAVFNWAASILCDSIQDVLTAANLQPGDVDLYVPHQANIRIINAAIDVLGIDRSKVYNNLDRYGNTSAASVPLGLDEARSEGRVQSGNHIVLSGYGAGLAWGTALLRW